LVENKYQITVNIKSKRYGGSIPFITANDHVIFEVEIYDGAEAHQVSSSYLYTLVSTKADKASVIREGTIDGNLIRFELGSSEMTEPGKVKAQVQIYESATNKRISSAPMVYEVATDPSVEGELPTDDKTLIVANKTLLDDAITKANNADARIDNIVAQAGDSNTEIVDMRLRTDGTSASSAGSHIRELASHLAQRPTEAEVDTKVAQIVSGSPKGTYASLSALQTAFPTGTTGIYITTDNGHWYYWNGTAWTDGGVYQSTGIGDSTITPQKTTYLMVSKNLFNPNDPDVVLGGYFSSTNVLTTSSANNQTGFIPVRGGVNYTASKTYSFVNWYDIDKAFISSTTSSTFTSQGYVTAPSNARYARFISATADWSTFQVEQGTVSTAYVSYTDFDSTTLDVLKAIKGRNIQDKSISPQKTTFFNMGKNLFNPNDKDVLLGKYYNASNVLTTNANINQSGFIPVVEKKLYTASEKGNFVNWYDKNKTFLSSTPSSALTNQGYVSAPVNARYARFLCTTANWSTFQVEEGTKSTAYEPFYFEFSLANALSSVLENQISAEAGKFYKIVACVIRQPAAGGGWNVINDAGHEPLNVASVTNDTFKITVNYNFTANKVISLVAVPDETFVQSGYSFGASVMTDRADIYISAVNAPVAGYVRYNGTAWEVLNARGGLAFTSFDASGNLRLDHNSMGGTSPISAMPLNSPYLLKVINDGTAHTTLQFTDYNGNVITTPDTNMQLQLYRQPMSLAVNPNDLKSDSGNIWIYGIMKV
jgi:hypothetical protein